MSIVARFARLVAAVLTLSSVLLVLAGGNLLFAGWLFWTRHERFWSLCWSAAGFAFIAFGIVSLLDAVRRLPESASELLRPLLKLGAIALVLAGGAWPLQTELHWRQTGDFEAYGVVIGLIMALHGVAAYWWLERPREQEAAS